MFQPKGRHQVPMRPPFARPGHDPWQIDSVCSPGSQNGQISIGSEVEVIVHPQVNTVSLSPCDQLEHFHSGRAMLPRKLREGFQSRGGDRRYRCSNVSSESNGKPRWSAEAWWA